MEKDFGKSLRGILALLQRGILSYDVAKESLEELKADVIKDNKLVELNHDELFELKRFIGSIIRDQDLIGPYYGAEKSKIIFEIACEINKLLD